MKASKCVIALAGLCTIGCAQVGRDFPIERCKEIEPGRSTRSDVERILGKPTHVGLEADGSGWWGYVCSRAVVVGPLSDVRAKKFQVFFDSNGVVTRKKEATMDKPPLQRGDIHSTETASKPAT